MWNTCKGSCIVYFPSGIEPKPQDIMWFAKVDIYDKHLSMSKPPKAKRSAKRLYFSDATLLATIFTIDFASCSLKNRGLFDWSQTQTSLPLMDRIGDSQQKATP